MAEQLGDAVLTLRTKGRQKAQRDVESLERGTRKLDKSFQGTERSINRNAKSAAGLGTQFRSVRQRASSLRGTLVTLGAITLFGKAIKDSLQFERSLSKIVGLVGVGADEVAGMRKELLKLGPAVGRGPNELAEALFFVTSAGLKGRAAMEVLEASAKAASAGLGETKTVADLVTSAVNAYGAETLSAAQATDILVASVREGKAEAPALAASMGQVLPVASEMGVRFDEVGASIAAMTRTGTDAGTAAIQLRQILAGLLKPAADTEAVLEEFGFTAQGVRRSIREQGLITTLTDLKNAFGDNQEALGRLFPNVRSLSGFLDLLGGNAEENKKIFDNLTESTGSLDKAFNAAAETGSFKLDQSIAKLSTSFEGFSGSVMPPVFDALSTLIDLFTTAIEKARSLTTEFIAVGIKVLPLLQPLRVLASLGGDSGGPAGPRQIFSPEEAAQILGPTEQRFNIPARRELPSGPQLGGAVQTGGTGSALPGQGPLLPSIDTIFPSAEQVFEQSSETIRAVDEATARLADVAFHNMDPIAGKLVDTFSLISESGTSNFDALASGAMASLSAISAATDTEGKKQFKLNKKIGIAQAIVSTIIGMNKALELGFPLGPPAAALIAGIGFANVKRIQSTSFGGGGSIGGGAGGTPSVGPDSIQTQDEAGADQEEGGTLIFNLESRRRSFSREEIADIFEGINEEQRRGRKLRNVVLA